jgi:hypothetical protein
MAQAGREGGGEKATRGEGRPLVKLVFENSRYQIGMQCTMPKSDSSELQHPGPNFMPSHGLRPFLGNLPIIWRSHASTLVHTDVLDNSY